MKRIACWWLPLLLSSILLVGCHTESPAPVTAAVRPELVILNWPDYIPPAVLQAFSDEFGADVRIVPYDSTDEATTRIYSGEQFDIAILEQEYVAPLVQAGRLEKMDYALLPNARNLRAEFRDLVHDPSNVYSIPHTWGTSGLIVRPDMVDRPIRRWEDLWDPSLAGQVLIRAEPSDVLGVTLLTLGLPMWTNDRQLMEQAVQKLLKLKGQATFTTDSTVQPIDTLVKGDVAVVLGWSSDATYAREQNIDVDYVIPEEGSLFWLERFVIFADSKQQRLAHAFINFVLRPEVSAAFTNEYFDATANEAALLFVEPEIKQNPAIYPAREDFMHAIWYPPFDAETSRFYEETWNKVLPILLEP